MSIQTVPPSDPLHDWARRLLFALALVTFGRLPVAQEPVPPNSLTVEQSRVTVTGYDTNRPDPYPGRGEFSWAGNILRQNNGELLLVHSAGYYHVSFAQPRLIEQQTRRRWLANRWPLEFEAPTGGRSMMTRSTDGGRSWTKPKTLIDLPWDDVPYGLIQSHDGSLLCFINVQASWYGFDKAPDAFAEQLDGLNTQQCVVRSRDGGRTWSEPVWLQSPGDFYQRSHAQPIVLSSGRILWPTYCKSRSDVRLFGAIHASEDHGVTWKLLSKLYRDGSSGDRAEDGSGNIDEPAIAALPDGKLFLISRPDGAWFTSTDAGKSWVAGGQLVESGKFKAPCLFVLDDGTIVCVCTWRNLQVFIGTGGGTHWTGPLDLDSTSYGYPGGVMLPDRSILVSYCSSGKAPNRVHVMRFRVSGDRKSIVRLPVGE